MGRIGSRRAAIESAVVAGVTGIGPTIGAAR
jgi:hypothetical protein